MHNLLAKAALETHLSLDACSFICEDVGFHASYLNYTSDPAAIPVDSADVVLAFADFLEIKGIDPNASTAAFERVDEAVREVFTAGTCYDAWCASGVYDEHGVTLGELTCFMKDAAPKGVSMSQVRALISAAFIRGNWGDMVSAYLNRDAAAAAAMLS